MKSFKMIKSHSTLSLSIALNISAVIPDGPGALLFFICSSACSISFRVISCSGPSVVFSSSNVSLAFSLLSSSSKYDFHLSLIASSSVKILPLLSLIMFTACLSILFLCLVFAILYIFTSPSFVLSSSYRWCTEMFLDFATLFLVSLLVILYAFLRSASSRCACHLLNASFFVLDCQLHLLRPPPRVSLWSFLAFRYSTYFHRRVEHVSFQVFPGNILCFLH